MDEDLRKFYLDWNYFATVCGIEDIDFKKQLADLGSRANHIISGNISDTTRILGDIGIVEVLYSPQTIWPYFAYDGKVVYATSQGVFYGKNKDASDILQNFPLETSSISENEVLILNEMIGSGIEKPKIWKYLTDENLSVEVLPNMPGGETLGLEKGNWIDACRFMGYGKDDLLEHWLSKTILDMCAEGHAPEIKEITDYDELTPVKHLVYKECLDRGANVEVICGPTQAKIVNLTKRYLGPIKLGNGSILSFSPDNVAKIYSKDNSVNVNEISPYEKCRWFTGLSVLSKKPVVARLAAQVCEEAIEKDRKNPVLYGYLGGNLYRDADLTGAICAWREEYELSSGKTGFAGACSDLGFGYSKIGNYPEAIKLLEKSIGLEPEGIFAHNNLATVQHLLAAKTGKAKHCALAEQNYLKELEINSDHHYAEKMLRKVQRLGKILSAG